MKAIHMQRHRLINFIENFIENGAERQKILEQDSDRIMTHSPKRAGSYTMF